MPSQQSEDLRQLAEAAMLGEQLDAFLASDVGRYLQTRAQRAYNAAVEEFKRCDPAHADEIRRIQSDMWKAEAFMGWVTQGIQEGLSALKIIEGVEDDPEIL